MSEKTNIIWFRQDLRLKDNPALFEASKNNNPNIFVYILDNINADIWQLGGARKLWLYYSLQDLARNLENKYNAKLVIKQGDAVEIIKALCDKHNVNNVFWNRCYEPWRIKRDKVIKQDLEDKNISSNSFNGSLLFEPWEIKNKSDSWFKVFTPFWRACLNSNIKPREILPEPEKLEVYKGNTESLNIDNLDLLPTKPNWGSKLLSYWDITEKAALEKLYSFLENTVSKYSNGRNNMDIEATSLLSPYLANGQISPNQIYFAALQEKHINPNKSKDIDKYLSEVGWREFSYNLLYHNPNLPEENFKKEFDNFLWDSEDNTSNMLKKWQIGQTGYPVIDAAMRELWNTGYMHNRARMIVASFLTKDLFIKWQTGEEWFWDCLFDADLANNSASWQWTAGSGADASPYFRVFNPILQGQKFDTEGKYVKQWVPELAKLSSKYIHCPWEAPQEDLKRADIKLGVNYPNPIVKHSEARDKALALYKKLKEN